MPTKRNTLLHKRNKTRKYKFHDVSTERSSNKNRDRNFASQRQRANDQIRAEGRKTLELYKSRGMEIEFYELIRELRERGVHPNMKVYDKEGNLIPLMTLDNKPPATSKFNKTVANQITARIMKGETFKQICEAEADNPDFPSLNLIRTWYKKYPEFARMVDEAYTERADYYVDQLYELMEEVKIGNLEPKRASFVADQIKWIAERLNPKFAPKGKNDGINVQVNDDGKVQFQILLAPTSNQDDKRLAIAGTVHEGAVQSIPAEILDEGSENT